MRAAVPLGELVFPADRLSAAVDGTVVWRGFIRRGEKNRTPVWAKARVRGSFRQIVAVEDLKPASPWPPAPCARRPAGAFRPRSRRGAHRPGGRQGAAAHHPRRRPVPLDAMAPPNEVEHGQTVTVEVRCGGTASRSTAWPARMKEEERW